MSKYDVCPVCGNPKRSVAKTCKQCRFFDMRQVSVQPSKPETITPQWLSEFRGLFWGEGSAFIAKNNSSYNAVVCLGLRSDDQPLLDDILAKLGGSIVDHSHAMKTHPKANPGLQWKVTSLEQVHFIVSLLLEETLLPAKKIKDVQVVLEFCKYRLPRKGRLLSPEERDYLKSLYELSRQSRVFKERSGQVVSA